MSAGRDGAERSRRFGNLLIWLGALLLLSALLYDLRLVAALHPASELSPEAVRETGLTRALFGGVGAGLALLGLAVRAGRRFPRTRLGAGLALALLTLALPVFYIERVLRPFVEQHTTIFAPDDELGWRLVPGAADDWLGVPVRINSKGVRGPERDHFKPAGTRRVLFLGDSVTFGAFLEDDRETLPAQVEERLRAETGSALECINGAVGGYSPWQELGWLEREGARYDPDLVVLAFVLNDVTEKLELERFGGWSEGFQLERSLPPGWRRWLEGSAAYHFARRLRARLEYGEDVQEGAREREEIGLLQLVMEPDRAGVRGAWQLTLQSVRGIHAWCRKRDVPLLVVMLPWTVQLERPHLDAPQRVLGEWCARREVPFLDLVPEVLAVMEKRGLVLDDLYVSGDAIHPNAGGHAIMGAIVSRRVIELGLLEGR